MNREEARNFLVIPQQLRIYLLYADGMRPDSVIVLCDELMKREPGEYAVMILVPRGSAMRQTLEQRYAGDERIQVVIYTQKMYIYLQAADVLLCRADAFILAQTPQLPTVLIAARNETASRNLAVYTAGEMALKANGMKDAAQKAKRLIDDKALACRMRQMQKHYAAAAAK